MYNRRAELLWAEALRHEGIAKLDGPRRLEHLEVAEALAYAAKRIAKEDKPCSSETKSHSHHPPGRRKRARRLKAGLLRNPVPLLAGLLTYTRSGGTTSRRPG